MLNPNAGACKHPPASKCARHARDDRTGVGGKADVRQKLVAVGFEIVGSTPQELDRFVRSEVAHWDKFVREFNIKFE